MKIEKKNSEYVRDNDNLSSRPDVVPSPFLYKYMQKWEKRKNGLLLRITLVNTVGLFTSFVFLCWMGFGDGFIRFAGSGGDAFNAMLFLCILAEAYLILDLVVLTRMNSFVIAPAELCFKRLLDDDLFIQIISHEFSDDEDRILFGNNVQSLLTNQPSVNSKIRNLLSERITFFSKKLSPKKKDTLKRLGSSLSLIKYPLEKHTANLEISRWWRFIVRQWHLYLVMLGSELVFRFIFVFWTHRIHYNRILFVFRIFHRFCSCTDLGRGFGIETTDKAPCRRARSRVLQDTRRLLPVGI